MILADENIDFRIIRVLRNNNFDVYSISEMNSGISDEQVIELARKNKRIILTEDKDFGEWVFAHKITDVGIVFLRYNSIKNNEIIALLVQFLNEKIDSLSSKFTTITINKIRIRNLS
jgi:predicted nuclease of predicted toxin-antitoxin system